jgi:hypothetical protein
MRPTALDRIWRTGWRTADPAAAVLVAAAAALNVECGSSSSGSSPAAQACAPGMSIACVGAAACAGYQVCEADGTGFTSCDCNGGGADAGNRATDGAHPDVDSSTASSGGPDSGAETAPAVPSAPVAVSASARSALESEVQLAVAADGTVAIAWIAESTTASWIAYRFSQNGGATFSPIAAVSLPGTLQGSDPALTVDSAGNFYLAMLGIEFTGVAATYSRVYVAKAAKGSLKFGAPVEFTGGSTTSFFDHPKILATASGKVVVAYADTGTATSTTSIGRTATSSDGQTWQLGTIVDQSSAVFSNLFWLCEGAGILYTTYLESTQTLSYIALRSSTDDGATWSTTSTIVSGTDLPAGLDPGCVASGDEAWVAYATNQTPTTDPTNWLDSAQAIRVGHLSNRGGSLDTTRIDALDTAASKLGLLPVLVREPGGALDVAYLAGDMEGDAQGSMRYARAPGSGSAFGPSVAVDSPLQFTMNRAMSTWLGDYLGAVYSGGRLLMAYPVNSSGISHIFFRSMELP